MSLSEHDGYTVEPPVFVEDEHAYFDMDNEGGPWRRNQMAVLPRNTEVDKCQTGFIANLGDGVSVFDLGRVPLDPEKEQDYGRCMAAALSEDTQYGVQAQLVQTTHPNVSARKQLSMVPTLLLVVRAKQPDTTSGSSSQGAMSPLEFANQKIELMQAKRTELAREWLATQGEDAEGTAPDISRTDIFTYENLAASNAVKQRIQASGQYRATLAATLVKALEPCGVALSTDIFSADKSVLYPWFSQPLCRIDVTPDYVRLVSDYNTPDCEWGCVFHGPRCAAPRTPGFALIRCVAAVASPSTKKSRYPGQFHGRSPRPDH